MTPEGASVADRYLQSLAGGEHFIQGDEAAAMGAIFAGCTFFGGYPITPASEIAEVMARELPRIGGYYVQFEDELASISAVVGAAWSGARSMTATSGPGFSLMQETVGYACMTETPCVIVDVQRSGPSTGQATLPAQGDVMQARWGTHGDHEMIALSPSTVQECLDLMIRCVNLSEQYRNPVIFLMDGEIGHLRERTVFPDPSKVEIRERLKAAEGEAVFGGKTVPPMLEFGEGKFVHVTGSTHKPDGMRDVRTMEVHDDLVRPRLRRHGAARARGRPRRPRGGAEGHVRPADHDLAVPRPDDPRGVRGTDDAARAGDEPGPAESRDRALRGLRGGVPAEDRRGPPQDERDRGRDREGGRMRFRELVDPEYFDELKEAVEEPKSEIAPPAYGTGDPLAGLVLEEPEAQGPRKHRLLKYLRQEILPTTFCVGCGGGTVLNAFTNAVDEMGLDPTEMVAVTGIGCSSWIPSPYFLCDTLHTTHGRAVAFASGVKVMLPEMKVIIIAGDGDLAGIGGNHLIHAARRNIDMAVFLVNNFIYGMTGGQVSPTTPFGIKTTTTPYHNVEHPMQIADLVAAAGASYVSRWTTYHPFQLMEAMQYAIRKKGFAFIEIISQCPVSYGKSAGQKDAVSALHHFKDSCIHVEDAEGMTEEELEGKFVVGRLVERHRSEFTESLANLNRQTQAEVAEALERRG